MATASIELGTWGLSGAAQTAINARCYRQESLTISAVTATLATAVTAEEASRHRVEIARIATDTDCYFAVGGTPDPTVTTATSESGARRLLSAGTSIEVPISVGQKVAVKAVS